MKIMKNKRFQVINLLVQKKPDSVGFPVFF
jgi:hypothetical protein